MTPQAQPIIHRHSAATGSCHDLQLGNGRSILINCGLFQGAETSPMARVMIGSRSRFLSRGS